MKPDEIKLLEERLEEAGESIFALEPRNLLDECVVGLGRRFHDTFLIYDQSCVIRQLTKSMGKSNSLFAADLDDEGDAREFFEFNTVGAWVGPMTPAFLVTDDG